MEETNFLTVQECENIVKKCLKSDDVQNIRFTAANLTNRNFLLKVTVNYNTEEKTLNFFAKTAQKIPKIYKILFDDFKKTVPKFDPKITPKLYYVRPDLLLLEDLTWQGFRTYDSKLGFFDLDHLQVVLRVLAKFHSGSFAYEEIKSEETGKIYRLDQEYKLHRSVIDLEKQEVTALISSLLDDKSEENFVKTIENLKEAQFSSKFRRTLCHANLIPQNIMFKYENETPIECKLINFKSKRYAPPICDVLQLIFFNTSEDLRSHHFEALLLGYYKCIEEELNKYCIKIQNIIPLGDWQLQTHRFLPLIKLETNTEELSEDLNCPIVSRQDCYTIIKNKTGSSDYKLSSFKISPVSGATGYLGNYHKLQIKSQETINCFVKCIPKNKSSKDVVEQTGCFFKEIFIYDILVPKIRKLGINTIDDCLPKCYFYRSEDLTVFEDLSSQNYKSLQAQIPYDFSLLSATVKKMAKFHASTIIFEEEMTKKLNRNYRLGEEYKDYLREIFFCKEETHCGALLMQNGLRSIVDVVDLFPEMKTEENEANFKTCYPHLQEIFYELIKPSKVYRNVLSHGDLWSNNIMVRSEPIDCKFVDFQCTRYCPPAHDFLSVMYLTTDRLTRIKHEEEIGRVYHEEFGKILSSFGYKIEEVYPYREFIETVDYIRPEMIMQAIMYDMFIMVTSEEISSFLTNDEDVEYVFFKDRKEYLRKICEKSPIVKTKLKECLIDLYDLCKELS